jgi:putative flippase GtrA
MKKILNYCYSVRHQFAKYFVVGFSGLFIDMGTLILLKEYCGWAPVLAVVVNQILMITYNFTLNKYWSFKNKEMPHRQIVKYLILAGCNYLFSILIMYIFNHLLDFDYRLVRLATIAVMVSWNFFLYKYWVYKQDIKF